MNQPTSSITQAFNFRLVTEKNTLQKKTLSLTNGMGKDLAESLPAYLLNAVWQAGADLVWFCTQNQASVSMQGEMVFT